MLDPDRYRHAVRDRLEPGDDVDVSIIVVTHESRRFIDACLSSIDCIDGSITREVIVVDNASQDGTAEFVAALYPDVRLIRGRGRQGFSFNCNIGASVAGGRYVLLLNPDAVLREGAVERLIAELEDAPEVAATAPRLLYPDGSDQFGARNFPTARSFVLRRTPLRWVVPSAVTDRHHVISDVLHLPAVDIDWALGAALLVRREAYAALEGLDEGYRLYCEDIDFCWRLHEHGWRVRLVPGAEVVHELAEVTRKRFFTRRSIWHLRGMLRFVRLHGLPRRPVQQVDAAMPLAVVVPG